MKVFAIKVKDTGYYYNGYCYFIKLDKAPYVTNNIKKINKVLEKLRTPGSVVKFGNDFVQSDGLDLVIEELTLNKPPKIDRLKIFLKNELGYFGTFNYDNLMNSVPFEYVIEFHGMTITLVPLEESINVVASLNRDVEWDDEWTIEMKYEEIIDNIEGVIILLSSISRDMAAREVDFVCKQLKSKLC